MVDGITRDEKWKPREILLNFVDNFFPGIGGQSIHSLLFYPVYNSHLPTAATVTQSLHDCQKKKTFFYYEERRNLLFSASEFRFN